MIYYLQFIGGKELRTYGVDFYSGEVQYTCSASGCDAQPPTASSTGLFLIVRRHSQIVRAIEPRTGTERWNFSVGRHEVSLIKNGEGNGFHILYVFIVFFFIIVYFIHVALAECKKNHMGTQENKHFMNCLNEHLQAKEEDTLSEPLVKVTNKADINFKVFGLCKNLVKILNVFNPWYNIILSSVAGSWLFLMELFAP